MLVTVEGAAEASRALRRAATEVDALPRTVGRTVAETTLVAAVWGAPRRTGTLAASGYVRTEGEDAAVVFGARYAPPVHYGVPSRGMAAQPFLTDAAARTEAAHLATLTRAVEQIARRAD